jgi:hypothetical protein
MPAAPVCAFAGRRVRESDLTIGRREGVGNGRPLERESLIRAIVNGENSSVDGVASVGISPHFA